MENTQEFSESSESSVRFVMTFYDITKEEALLYYKDEILAYENLRNRFEQESNLELIKTEEELWNNYEET